MKKVVYIAQILNREKGRERHAVAAADLQATYLSEILDSIGYEVEILSPNIPLCGTKIIQKQRGFVKKFSDHVSVHYFDCLFSKNRLIQAAFRRLIILPTYKYIKKNKDAIFIIYHSRLLYSFYRMLERKQVRFILELEEIYADVSRDNTMRAREIREISRADAYILPSIPLAEEITNGKRYILYHGTCRHERKISRGFEDGLIHIVYAGTFDVRVIGDMSFINVARFLDERYAIHILGFGVRQSDTDRVVNEVMKMQGLACKVTYEGMLFGDDYIRFIQSCDIGLFTRNPDDLDNKTSFPSKIMSYLSNGLRVVSIRVDSIEKSEVKNLIYFCDSNNPEDIAKTIRSIDFAERYNPQEELQLIENKLRDNLAEMLSSLEKGE